MSAGCEMCAGAMKEMGKATTGRLNNGVSQIPPPKAASELSAFQMTLPIYGLRAHITKVINDNRVMMVSGETGSGKTTQVSDGMLTDVLVVRSRPESRLRWILFRSCISVFQVPQMILDDCQAQNKPCRIFCTQPRRLSALSVAERVAAERNERIGQTVGYQIRLESR